MSKPYRVSRKLRDQSWEQANSTYDSHVENELFSHAFDVHMGVLGNHDNYAALFYLLSSRSYKALNSIPGEVPMTKEEVQQNFFNAGCELLAKLLQDIYSTSILEDKKNELVGIVNELTPVVLLNYADSVSYLASGVDDRRNRTDLFVKSFSSPETPPLAVQAKSSDFVSTEDIPENGVLISASDYGNRFLEVSDSLVSVYEGKDSSTDRDIIKLARNRISETISQQQDRSLQQNTVRYKQIHSYSRFNRERPLNSHIGKNIPELIQLRKDLLL